MGKYIALLRGINVSGQKKLPMATLRKVMSGAGYKSVATYIQSGNVVFESEEMDLGKLEASISILLKEHFGFEVPVLVKSGLALEEILRNSPYQNAEELASNQIYFVLLSRIPVAQKVIDLKREIYPDEIWEIKDDCLYLKCYMGYGKAKLNNNRVERKLGVTATTRNYRTLTKLLEMVKV